MSQLRIDWIQSPDDPTLGGSVVSYELARSTGPNPTAVIATIPAQVDAQDTLYLETLPPGHYYYRVRAVNDLSRRSLWSAEADVIVTAQDPVVEVLLTFEVRPQTVVFEVEPRGSYFEIP